MRSESRERVSLTEHRFDTTVALADGLADALAHTLDEALNARGRATLVVSGGSTPRDTFIRLAQKPIAWRGVTVVLADERWVPPSDPASNEAFVRRHLLTGPGAAAKLAGLYTGDPTPEAGQPACAARIEGLPRPFDAILLGMGDDGHTASLFPGSPGLVEALDPAAGSLVCAIRSPHVPPPRMTLTMRALLDAGVAFLLFKGRAKRAVFESALGDGPIEDMPIRAVLRQQRVPLEIYWTSDE